MASTFINAHAELSPTESSIFVANTVGLRSAVVHGIFIANTGDLSGTLITLKVYDSSANTERKILNKIPIAPNSTLVLEKPINLEPNDELRAFSSNIYCSVFASILLIT